MPEQPRDRRQVHASAHEAAAIRERYARGGTTHLALAREYGVSKTLVFYIIKGRMRRRAFQRFDSSGRPRSYVTGHNTGGRSA